MPTHLRELFTFAGSQNPVGSRQRLSLCAVVGPFWFIIILDEFPELFYLSRRREIFSVFRVFEIHIFGAKLLPVIALEATGGNATLVSLNFGRDMPASLGVFGVGIVRGPASRL